MTAIPASENYNFEISLSILNHLGRNLYRSYITVLGEAISNAWDADAENVWIYMDKESDSFAIIDDGIGMTSTDFQERFLSIGYSKRKQFGMLSKKKRPFIGSKGIGKLALLSCAKRVSICSKTKDTDYTGGTINNDSLDLAIENQVKPSNYSLDPLDFKFIDPYTDQHNHGTILLFDDIHEGIINHPETIRRMLAKYFCFSVISGNFSIFVNDEEVGIGDLQNLLDNTQFLWTINGHSDEFVSGMNKLHKEPIDFECRSEWSGFLATVEKPRNLSISKSEERATLDLFVNGRLRERNVLKHIPTNRIVESYLYGQIHYNGMDREDADPFTSSREGVIESDQYFKSLLNFLSTLMPKVFDRWDEYRVDLRYGGDDENMRIPSIDRASKKLSSEARKVLMPEPGEPNRKVVEELMKELDAYTDRSFPSYAICFYAENLFRDVLRRNNVKIPDSVKKKVLKWKSAEMNNLETIDIKFNIRENSDDYSYLGMSEMAKCAQFSEHDHKSALIEEAKKYAPFRNVVGHTGKLTENANNFFSATFANFKAKLTLLIREDAVGHE